MARTIDPTLAGGLQPVQRFTGKEMLHLRDVDGRGAANPISDVFSDLLGATYTKSVLLVVGGQSIRRGSGKQYVAELGLPTDQNAYVPYRARSIVNRQADPIAPAKGRQGSWWPRLIDQLAARGIEVDVVNASIGGSTIRQWIGAFRSWATNTAYYAQRGAENGDAGDKGEFLIAGGKVWRCTTGRKRIGYTAPGGTIDYILASGAQVSGATAPDWASVTTVGGTLNDGGLVWTLVENGNASGYSVNTAMSPTNGTFGDPLGLCARMGAAADAAIAGKTYDEVRYLWGTGSSETPALNGAQFYATDEVVWRDRLLAFTNWALTTKGANLVALGLDPWNPALGGETSNNRQLYDVLDRGLDRAIVSYQGGANDGKVIRAANLYRLFAFTPPVYPEAAAPAGIHLTDVGNAAAGDAEIDAFLAKSAGAVDVPYVRDTFNLPTIQLNGANVASATVGTAYSMFRGNFAGGFTAAGTTTWNIDGVAVATGSTFTPPAGSAGKRLSVTQAMSNAKGTGTATSAEIPII